MMRVRLTLRATKRLARIFSRSLQLGRRNAGRRRGLVYAVSDAGRHLAILSLHRRASPCGGSLSMATRCPESRWPGNGGFYKFQFVLMPGLRPNIRAIFSMSAAATFEKNARSLLLNQSSRSISPAGKFCSALSLKASQRTRAASFCTLFSAIISPIFETDALAFAVGLLRSFEMQGAYSADNSRGRSVKWDLRQYKTIQRKC